MSAPEHFLIRFTYNGLPGLSSREAVNAPREPGNQIVQDQDKRVLETLREGAVGDHEYVFGKPDKGSILWAKRRRQELRGAKHVLPAAATTPAESADR